MEKSLRKAFLIGLGITLLTKEKVEKEVRALMKEHRITEKEGKRLAKTIIRQGMKHKKDIERKIRAAEQEIRKKAKRD